MPQSPKYVGPSLRFNSSRQIIRLVVMIYVRSAEPGSYELAANSLFMMLAFETAFPANVRFPPKKLTIFASYKHSQILSWAGGASWADS